MKGKCDICASHAKGSALCLSCMEAITRLISISSRFCVEYDNQRVSYTLTATPTEELERQGGLAANSRALGTSRPTHRAS